MSLAAQIGPINITNSVINFGCSGQSGDSNPAKPVIPNFGQASPAVDPNSTSVTGTSQAGTVSFAVTAPGVLSLPISFAAPLPHTPTVLVSSLTTSQTTRGLYVTNVSASGFTVNSTSGLISANVPVYSFTFMVN